MTFDALALDKYLNPNLGVGWVGLYNSDTSRCCCMPLGINVWMILTSPHSPPVWTMTMFLGWCAAQNADRITSGVMTTQLPHVTQGQDWSIPLTPACVVTPLSGEMCPAANTLMTRESTAMGSGALVRTCSVSTPGTQAIKEMRKLWKRVHILLKLTRPWNLKIYDTDRIPSAQTNRIKFLTSALHADNTYNSKLIITQRHSVIWITFETETIWFAPTKPNGCLLRIQQSQIHTFASHPAPFRALTASPAPTLHTSSAPSQVSVFIQTSSVTAIPSAQRERMRI